MNSKFFLSLSLAFSCAIAWSSAEVDNFRRLTLTPGVTNNYALRLSALTTNLFKFDRLVPGDVECVFKGENFGDHDLVEGEASFFSPADDNFQDRFRLTNTTGRRTEYVIAGSLTDPLTNFFQGFILLDNKSQNEKTVNVSCKLNAGPVPTTRTKKSQSESRSFYIVETNLYREYVEELFAKIVWYKQRVKDNIKEIDTIRMEIVNRLEGIRKKLKRSVIPVDFEVPREVFLQIRDFLVQVRGAIGQKVGEPPSDYQELVERTNEYFSRIIPSAKEFLRDHENEINLLMAHPKGSFTKGEQELYALLEQDVARCFSYLKSVRWQAEINDYPIMNELALLLAARLHGIHDFTKKQHSLRAYTIETGPYYDALLALYERLFSHRIELENHRIISMLSQLKLPTLPGYIKKLLQLSPGLHPLIEAQLLNRTPVNLSSQQATFEIEANAYGLHYEFVTPSIVPMSQWIRRRTLLPRTKADIENLPLIVPKPDWLGLKTPLATLQPIVSSDSNLPPPPPQFKEDVMESSTGGAASSVISHDEVLREIIENPNIQPLPLAPLDQHEISLTHEIEHPIEIEQAYLPSAEEIFWHSQTCKSWDASTKKQYQAYIHGEPKDIIESNSPHLVTPISRLNNLNSKQANTLDNLLAQIPGVAWDDFVSLCAKMGIELRKPRKGSSHRTAYHRGVYLGTVWRPHKGKGAPVFGIGQTKIIKKFLAPLVLSLTEPPQK